MKAKHKAALVVAGTGAGLLGAYLLSRRALAAVDVTSKENVFYRAANKLGAMVTGDQGFDLQTRVIAGEGVQLTESAERGQQWYIDRGFAYIDRNGVFKLTPKGEQYVTDGASTGIDQGAVSARGTSGWMEGT